MSLEEEIKMEDTKVVIETVPFNTLDYGELDLFEEIVGMIPNSDAQIQSMPTVKFILAMGLITAQRDKPETTMDEIKRLPLGAIKLHVADENVGVAEGNG